MNAQQHCDYVISAYLEGIFEYEEKDYRPRLGRVLILGVSRSYHLVDVRWELPYKDPKTGLWEILLHSMVADVRRLGGVHSKTKLTVHLNFPDIFSGCADWRPHTAALIHAFEEDIRCAADTLKQNDSIAVFKVR